MVRIQGKIEEAGVVDDMGETGLPLFPGPADPSIAGGAFQAEAPKPRQASGVSPDQAI